MRIYTRAGDDGSTSLLGGRRVRKDDNRIAVCGEIDELSSTLGLAASFAPSRQVADLTTSLQADLMTMASEIAGSQQVTLGSERVVFLEAAIDRLEEQLPRLTRFVIPGGSPAGAALHLARAVARRVERSVVTLQRTSVVSDAILAYCNRLSDLLFLLARQANEEPDRREYT